MKEIKKLGFGAMRLPKLDDGTIDLPQVCDMVDLFVSRGFTYFDTAYVYGMGDSERALRECLVKRYPRESFTLATKLPSFLLKEDNDKDRIFKESLDNLGTDFVDFYLLHNVNSGSIKTYDKLNCWSWLEQLRETGKAKHVGFSFHDTPELLDQVLTEHPFVDFVQLQINYIDWEAPKVRSRECLETAKKHGKPVVVMKPVKGGLLASLPEDGKLVFNSIDPQASPASFAIRYVASQEGVYVVLSGMSTTFQADDNTSFMKEFNPLNAKEFEAIDKVVDVLSSIPTVPCTGCRYCVDGCPMQIEIPSMLSLLNNVRIYGATPTVLDGYGFRKGDGGDVWDCIGCGQCEGACPQHLEVPVYLAELSAAMGK